VPSFPSSEDLSLHNELPVVMLSCRKTVKQPLTSRAKIRRTRDDAAMEIDWILGDVLVLNNYQKMHSRAPYTGSRTLLAAMS